MRRSAIPIFANELVDSLVLAKLVHTRRQNNQLSIVGQRHARAIDRLVADPRGMKLAWIEINDCLVNLLVEYFEIDFQAELSRGEEAFDVVADEQSADREPTAL